MKVLHRPSAWRRYIVGLSVCLQDLSGRPTMCAAAVTASIRLFASSKCVPCFRVVLIFDMFYDPDHSISPSGTGPTQKLELEAFRRRLTVPPSRRPVGGQSGTRYPSITTMPRSLACIAIEDRLLAYATTAGFGVHKGDAHQNRLKSTF